MRSRFSLPVVSLAMAVAVVVGTGVLGLLGAAVGEGSPLTSAVALTSFMKPVLSVLVLGAVAGALGWGALVLIRRDGFHRMEWVALLPFHYGGHDPFDTSSKWK